MLKAPGDASARIHLDDNYMKTQELSRRIYAVRDCFRNVVQVSFGTSEKCRSPGGRDGVASLGAMCSMVIGSAIQAEYDSNVPANGGDDDEYMAEEELMEFANEIYEAIPPPL